MLSTFTCITHKRSRGEGVKSGGATVGQCYECPICLTKEHDRLFEESPAERSPADFFGPCGSVPCVSQIFCHLLLSHRNGSFPLPAGISFLPIDPAGADEDFSPPTPDRKSTRLNSSH